jgi:mono/diheme cytochrome c family protein
MKIRKLLMIAFAVIVAGFLLIQVVPYGRAHDNPTVVSEPNWDSPQTRELAQRACFDCHSNETVWPWYSNVAPVSWLVQHDVDEGRQYLNFSEWGRGGEGEETEELYEVIVDGKMPMPNYLVTHPEARLTDVEKAALADGLLATTGASSGEVESDHDSD